MDLEMRCTHNEQLNLDFTKPPKEEETATTMTTV
jgi:hypothetical protein